MPLLLFLSYGLLAVALQLSSGFYHPLSLVILCGSFFCLVGGFFLKHKKKLQFKPVTIAALILVLLIAIQLLFQPGLYIASNDYKVASFLFEICALLLVGVFYCIPQLRSTRITRVVYILLVLIAVALKFLIIPASPQPFIDAWVMLQESASNLLTGLNPYITQVTDIYQGADGALTIFGYSYLPASLEILTPMYAMFGDVRYGLVLAELLFVYVLWRQTKNLKSQAFRELLVLLWLWHPRGLFVTEQSWVDPLILGLFALSMWLYNSKKYPWAAAVYGLMLSLKQYLLFFVFHWLILERNWRHLALGAVVGTLTLVPFIIWDASALFQYGFLFQLSGPFRDEALTIASFLHRHIGFEPSSIWSLGVGTVVAGGTAHLVRSLPKMTGYLWATTITTFAIFLFGSQAFCNYYYLVSGLLLFLIADQLSGKD